MEACSRDIEVVVSGHRLVLMPERTAFWRESGTLMVADTHFGKADTIQAGGGPLSDELLARVLDEDLERLSSAAERSGASRILVVGDLIHAVVGLTPAVVDRVAAWSEHAPCPWELVPGNHDRGIHRVADAWRLTLREPVIFERRFGFVHDPDDGPIPMKHTVSGHVHPAVRLRGGGASLKLPVFVVGEDRTLLPAFSRFTGGGRYEPTDADRVFAVVEESGPSMPPSVVRVPARAW